MQTETHHPVVYTTKPDFAASCVITDAYDQALKELLVLHNPQSKFDRTKTITPALPGIKDIWIHFPWNNSLIHTVEESAYFALRTSRNRYVISEDEQQRLRNIAVGIAGLSVGSQILSTLVLSGGPKKIKIADFDVIEFTNLNRLEAQLSDVGKNKAQLAAYKVWELDPFAEIGIFDSGLTEQNLDTFLKKDFPLNVFIDEMDSFKLKIYAREKCRAIGIPVIMATDNGDNIIVDVERFDTEPTRPIFHGRLEGRNLDILDSLSYQEWIHLAIQVLGEENIHEKIYESLNKIGKTITGIPQLGGSARLAGYVITLFIRKLANNEPLESGQYVFDLTSLHHSNPLSKKI